MCGIAGWVSLNKPLPDYQQGVIQAMTETMRHRGPDAGGYWQDQQAVFGHRRLIVVDPQGGEQPMTRERDGRQFVIVYNGELYNTPELRKELSYQGYQFKTRNSDTEALLFAYMEWGTRCTDYLNGIFAFAVWDCERQTLFMARDRLGVKPLFYSQQGEQLLFASEIKALLKHPEVSSRVNREGLADLLVLGPSRRPGYTPFIDVRELEPGCQLVFDRDGVRTTRYWQLRSHSHEDNPILTVRRVREHLEDAVTRQLVSDVPLGTLLSGGLDSSAITILAAAASPSGLDTYSVDYIDSERFFKANGYETNLDRPWVEKVSALAATCHYYEMIANEELAAHLATGVKGHDLPGMTDIDVSLYLFSLRVKQGSTVALSGECADEVFGGYPWFHRSELINKPGFPWINYVKERAACWKPEIREWIKPEHYLEQQYSEVLDRVPRLPGESQREARLREIGYLSITRFLPVLLDRKDRMSMLASLEVRVPFADHKLVEYVWNIPWEIKNWGGVAKGVLREALSGLLPDDIRRRPKTPYPKTHNPVYHFTVRDMLMERWQDPASILHQLVNPEAYDKLLSGQSIIVGPWFGQLMGLTQMLAYLWQLDYWWQEYGVNLV